MKYQTWELNLKALSWITFTVCSEIYHPPVKGYYIKCHFDKASLSLSVLSASHKSVWYLIRCVLNFIWALVFFQNSIWFLTDNWFPKSQIFSLKSSLVKIFWFLKINCQSKTRWNFGKRPMPRWNWGYFWLPDTFMWCWDYWEAQARYLKMAFYLVTL